MKIHTFYPSILLLLLALALTSCGRDRTEPESLNPNATPTVMADSAMSDNGVTGSVDAPPVASPSAESAAVPELGIRAAPPVDAAAQAVRPTLAVSATLAAQGQDVPSEPVPAMSQARMLFTQGNYGEARTLTKEHLSSAALTEFQVALGQFELAKMYLVEALYGEALAVVDALLATPLLNAAQAASGLFSAVPLTEQARFLRAEALSGLGQYAEATAAYQSFLQQHPEAAEVIHAKIAANYLAQGDGANAATSYLAAAEAVPDTVTQVGMLEAAATNFQNVGRYTDAAAAYEQILAVAQNAGYRTTILYRLGQAWAAAGNESAAVEQWQAATAESPESASAYLALIELVNRNVTFDLYQRGYIDLQAEAWFPAIDAFEQYLASALPSDERAGLAMHLLGQAYLGAGDYASALTVLDKTLAQYPDCPCTGQIWLDKAAAQAASGDNGSARRTYRTFARTTPQDPLAPEALWRSGVSALWDNSELEAVADLLALADTFPTSERAPDALYAIGLGAYRTKLWSQMVQMYSRLQEAYPTYKPVAVGYWLGRAYEATNEPEQAKQQWQKLVAEVPDVYYGILAQESLRAEETHLSVRLDNLRVLARPASPNAADDGSQAFAEAWLATWAEPAEGAWAELPARVTQDADLALGRLLIDLDLRRDGARVLGRLYGRYRTDPGALFALMLEFERLQLHRLALLSAVTLIDSGPSKLAEESPIFLQKVAYPRPFIELVEPEAQANGIDPLLFFSLIRQESQFDDSARSVAAAQGLAQIIPDTADWVAERLRYPNFTDDLVYRPYINIKFGTYYLAWARDYLDDNIISALVGYNAGPGNAEAWRGLSGADDVLFVEVLGVNEPRIYVHNILANYYHYTRLYGDE